MTKHPYVRTQMRVGWLGLMSLAFWLVPRLEIPDCYKKKRRCFTFRPENC